MDSQDPEKHYRGTSVGRTLIATLDELPAIPPQLAEKIRLHFDRELLLALRSARVMRKRMNFRARCHTYRFYDDRWLFVLQDVKIKTDRGKSIRSDRISVNAISTGLEEGRRGKADVKSKAAARSKAKSTWS
ncbi:transcription initiation factor iia small chain [Diplodia corticola]|uniref:Transcription initiation factor IIA subunit 2 n=1 Tax=Diplodia corticola TaxID=236234 RepID=A0A1J9RBU7_9PEZI|nr:transcription initiation factor iia small chain [Diplodia corticola]OJD37626.1 transcription initiation factor iia small chain [Diplodia corticola]